MPIGSLPFAGGTASVRQGHVVCYPPAFPLKHQQKDLRLALPLADEAVVSSARLECY